MMSEEELLQRYLPQVHMVAKRIRHRFRNVDFDDLVGYGTIGLMKAIKSFDASRGILLKTYAEYRIRGEILDGLRVMNWLSRSACRRKARYEQSRSQQSAPLQEEEARPPETPDAGRPPQPLSIPLMEIHCAGWQLDDLDQMAQRSAWCETGAAEADPALAYHRKQLVRQVAQAMARLPQRHREVLRMHYQRDMTLKEISAILKVHQSRVSQLHVGALRQLRACIHEDGTPVPIPPKRLLNGGAMRARSVA